MDLFDRASLCSVSVCPCSWISVAVQTVQVVNSMSWLARICGSFWKFQELEAEEVFVWDVPGLQGGKKMQLGSCVCSCLVRSL